MLGSATMPPREGPGGFLIEWADKGGGNVVYYVFGYVLSVLGSWVVIPRVLNAIRPYPARRDSMILGGVEVLLYVTAWIWFPEFFLRIVAFWLGFKTLKEWTTREVWSPAAQIRYNSYLIGSVLSVLFGAAGGSLAIWLRESSLLSR